METKEVRRLETSVLGKGGDGTPLKLTKESNGTSPKDHGPFILVKKNLILRFWLLCLRNSASRRTTGVTKKEKQRDKLEGGLETDSRVKNLEKLLGKFEETVTSLNTLKTKLIEHRNKVDMLTVEELTKALKENLFAVTEVKDLEESYKGKELKIKLEIEKMKLANEKFVEVKVRQPSNDKETRREE
ncbi:unnamed protein product [Lepeophtheirus salmonis]|uniref:(salmon louse) hypothetical protein n=1 Tax=Lepeophtheirus salmonis TaxID=72036 RepID=A0A7R8CMC9_LEPSM|nr:unnamed protein product [Lepeophtheirus salmonis]CAF2820243.1 unnamed protein product [Lepeophtheirus salmonis]